MAYLNEHDTYTIDDVDGIDLAFLRAGVMLAIRDAIGSGNEPMVETFGRIYNRYLRFPNEPVGKTVNFREHISRLEADGLLESL